MGQVFPLKCHYTPLQPSIHTLITTDALSQSLSSLSNLTVNVLACLSPLHAHALVSNVSAFLMWFSCLLLV